MINEYSEMIIRRLDIKLPMCEVTKAKKTKVDN